ncbi:bifunctional DNA primase/polymerase [Arthrobacter cheniae]|nr:bifunctional DNA primase/polymerase [Arthrobacter cheniae]
MSNSNCISETSSETGSPTLAEGLASSTVDPPQALHYALQYAAKGWPVFPVYGIVQGRCTCKDGIKCDNAGKHPRTSNGVNGATTDPQTVRAWWTQWPDANIGLACGQVSGFFAVDVDAKSGGFESIGAFGQLPETLSVITGGGGKHLLFKYPADGVRLGNKVGWLRGVDVRSDGGYVVAAPSLHSSGARYSWQNEEVEIIEPPLGLIESIRGSSTRKDYSTDLKDSLSILEGIPEGERDDVLFRWACRLRRQHSTDADKGRRVVTLLVLEAANNSGFPENQARIKVEQAFKMDHPDETLPIYDPDGFVSDEDLDPSWVPENLDDVLSGQYLTPQPAILRRSDSVAMLYPGLIHAFYGEPESGKSFVAQWAAAEVLRDGGSVLYLDYESDRGTVVERLLLMGVDKEAVRRGFVYLRPDAAPNRGLKTLLNHAYALAVVDGVTEALSQSNVKSIDNDEVTKWIRQVPRRIGEETGAAVVMVDHVTKSREGRGRYALGAQAKLAAITGAAFTFETGEPLAPGKKGSILIRVAKDRPGGVRPHGDNWRAGDKTQEIATVFVDSTQASKITISVDPPARIAAQFREDLQDIQACLAVYRLVKETPGIIVGALKKGITSATGIGESQRLGDVIAMAKLKGLIRTETGARNSVQHYLSDGQDLTDWVRSIHARDVVIPEDLERLAGIKPE